MQLLLPFMERQSEDMVEDECVAEDLLKVKRLPSQLASVFPLLPPSIFSDTSFFFF